MSAPASPSAALPIAHVVLRILIVLNWLMAALILVLLGRAERAVDHDVVQALAVA